MIQMAPPRPPLAVALDDNDGRDRLSLRLWQLWWSLVTIFVTAWFCTLGWIPGIIAVITAKHILVAILMRGLGMDRDTPG